MKCSLGASDFLEALSSLFQSIIFLYFLALITEEEMGIPDHLTCVLRNLYAGQEATVRTGSKKEKEYIKAVYCHPAYLTSMQSTS